MSETNALYVLNLADPLKTSPNKKTALCSTKKITYDTFAYVPCGLVPIFIVNKEKSQTND
jgi:hypothetical protein